VRGYVSLTRASQTNASRIKPRTPFILAPAPTVEYNREVKGVRWLSLLPVKAMQLLFRLLTDRLRGLAAVLSAAVFFISLTNAAAQKCPESAQASCPAQVPVQANCPAPAPAPECPPVQTVVACSTATPSDTVTPVPTGLPANCGCNMDISIPECQAAGCQVRSNGDLCCFTAPYEICARCTIT
jgi:hypothetical protein